MKYIEFYQTSWPHTVIRLSDIRLKYPGFDQRRLHEWTHKNYLVKLGNGAYVFRSEMDKADEAMLFRIANRLYSHSYISLETALSHYQVIPEYAFQITSVSTLKTGGFETKIARFKYHSISPFLFWGYDLVGSDGDSFLIARPEKALIDLVHIRKQIRTDEDMDNMRLNWKMFNKIIDRKCWEEYLLAASGIVDGNKLKLLGRHIHA